MGGAEAEAANAVQALRIVHLAAEAAPGVQMSHVLGL